MSTWFERDRGETYVTESHVRDCGIDRIELSGSSAVATVHLFRDSSYSDGERFDVDQTLLYHLELTDGTWLMNRITNLEGR